MLGFPKQETAKDTPDYEYFVIFDSKVGQYRTPILTVNRHELLRDLLSFMADRNKQMEQIVMNAEDFSIFKVGEYSKKTGVIKAVPQEHICNLHDIRAAAWRRREEESSRTAPEAMGIVPT